MAWGRKARSVFGGGGGAGVGSGVGSAIAGPVGGIIGGAGGWQGGSGSQSWNQLGDKMGWGPNQKQHDAEARQREAMRGSYDAGVAANKDITAHEEAFYNRQMGRDDRYLTDAGRYDSKLVKDLEELRGQAKSQAKDARSTYSNDILPQYKNAMERDVKDSQSAMSLKEAGDVNNSVHRGVRDLYEKQAQGVGKQGLADAGVLAALGAQASAGQMGGVPMTGGQMAAIQGQNMAQSGMAYSRAQQQMQSLREQGLNRGFEESDRQFQRGQQALDRRDRSIGNFEGANNRMNAEQAAFRGEQQGLATQRTGVQQGMAGREYGVRTGTDQMGLQMDTAQANRTLANEQGYYGAMGGMAAGQAAAAGANQAGKIQTMGNLFGQGASAAMGAYGGGGGGAAAAPAAAAGSPYANQPANYGANTAAAPLPGLGGGDPAMAPGYTGSYGGGGGYGNYAGTSYSPGAYGNGYGPQNQLYAGY